MNQAQNKKNHEMKDQDSEQSSSLQFLDSGKQDDNEDDNEDDEGEPAIDYDYNINIKRTAQQKTQNIQKKRERNQQQNFSQSIFLYKPGVQLPNLVNFTNQSIKVIIASEYINKDNPSYLKRKIYGSDTYSSNSDCVCIAIHYGFFTFASFSSKKYQGVQLTFKVIKPKKNYIGTLKNGLQSQTIKNYNGNALKPQSCKMLTCLGSIENLQKYATNMRIPIGVGRIRAKPFRLSSIIPLPESNLVFNMNNQPAFKYSVYNIADKGFDKCQFFVRKLDHKALYLQTENKQRYELCKYIQKTFFQVYRFSKLKNPIKFDNQYFSVHHPPMDANDLEILQQYVQLDEIIFGEKSIRIKDTFVDKITSFKYYVIQPK